MEHHIHFHIVPNLLTQSVEIFCELCEKVVGELSSWDDEYGHDDAAPIYDEHNSEMHSEAVS